MLNRKGNKKSFLSKIVMFLNWILIVFLLFSYLSAYINPVTFILPAFIGLAYPYLLILNIIFMIVWIIKKRRFFIYSLIAILIGWIHLGKYVQFNQATNRVTESSTIKLLTYNVQNLAGSNIKLNEPETRQKITEFLKNSEADIICLQEFYLSKPDNDKKLNDFANELGMSFYRYTPYSLKKSTRLNALLLLSRYPVLNDYSIPREGSRNLGLYVDVLVNTDTIRIFNVHLESIHFKKEEIDFTICLGVMLCSALL